MGQINPKEDINHHKQCLRIAKELGDRAGEGSAYGNLGNAYQSLGNLKQAIKYHNQDLSIAKELGDRAGEGGAYGNLGNAYQSLGDFKQAVKYYNQRVSIAKDLGNRAGEGVQTGKRKNINIPNNTPGLSRMTDIVYRSTCGVIRQFSLIDRLWFGR